MDTKVSMLFIVFVIGAMFDKMAQIFFSPKGRGRKGCCKKWFIGVFSDRRD